MPTAEDLGEFDKYYAGAKEKVDERITEILASREEFATKRRLLEHSTKGGKRVRPVLTLLVSEVYDSPFDRAINHAAIVELIHNACVTGDTRVRMANGESVPIREINEGDEVLAFDEDAQSFVPQEVEYFHKNGVQNVVRVETPNRKVTCTPDHEFLVYRKEQETRYTATEVVADAVGGPVTEIAARVNTRASEGTVQNWLYGASKDWQATHYLNQEDARKVLDEVGVGEPLADVCEPKDVNYQSPSAGYEYVPAGSLSEGDIVVAAKQTSDGGESWDQSRSRSMRHHGDVVFPDGGPDYNEVGFSRVRSVEEVDEPQETFDLSVSGDHNYIADGVVTHNSLMSDDAYDEDAMRRGAPTLHTIVDKLPFGKTGHKAATGMAVMGGNGLVSLAMGLVKDPDVMNAMGEGTKSLVDGFFHEGLSVFNGVVGGGYEKYIEINKTKTGSLFALATWMPALNVDAPEEQEEAARKYGESVGILYQVADDYCDGDIPSYIDDPAEEMEKWYSEAVSHIDDMPDSDKEGLLRTAPAWVVYMMLKQEQELDSLEISFLDGVTVG